MGRVDSGFGRPHDGDVQALIRYLNLLEYELALQDAADSLIRFAEMVMPIERDLDDPTKTQYQAAAHHKYMAHLGHRIESGALRKGLLRTAPRHGKTRLMTVSLAAWLSGRRPDRDIIIGSYNSTFAETIGEDVRQILKSQRFRQIFPDYRLTKDAAPHVATAQGGNIYFIGKDSTVTGLGGHYLLLDDPIKNDSEARSGEFREKLWQWFTQTFLTRRHTDQATVLVTGTQWHEDDIFGRLTDTSNPAYSAALASGFEDIRLPVFADEDDPMGRKVGEVLWPDRFGRSYLNEMQEANPQAFSALYLCNPVPSRGAFYQADNIFEYDSHELPERLTIYCASDFAVSTKNINDRTCIMPYGVDDRGDAWILRDVIWGRMESTETVEHIIATIKKHKPVFWYCEKGQLTKALGPFIEKRMQEEGVYVPFITDMRTADKVQYAHAARNRCAQGRIRFPRFAPWWANAKTEMLKFPNARFDDFVDTLSVVGMKLNQSTGPGANLMSKPLERGSWGELKAMFRRQDSRDRERSAKAGW
jgi:predicted phage terminase large subunit-like protein